MKAIWRSAFPFWIAVAAAAPARGEEPEVRAALAAIADAKAALERRVEETETERAKLAALTERWRAAKAGSLEAIRAYCAERPGSSIYPDERRAIYLLLAAHDPAVTELRTGGIGLVFSPDPASSRRSAQIREVVEAEASALGVQLAKPDGHPNWTLRLSMDPGGEFGGVLRVEAGDRPLLPPFEVQRGDPREMALEVVDDLLEAILTAVRDGKL